MCVCVCVCVCSLHGPVSYIFVRVIGRGVRNAGTYFARDSSYSRQYCISESDGTSSMIMARVVSVCLSKSGSCVSSS